jgi:adenine-specific DNA-methyltransferase
MNVRQFGRGQLALFASPEDADAPGERHCATMSVEQRRASGITLTPAWLVDRMLGLVEARGSFDTIVNVGAGSGRFAIAAARRFPASRVLAVENDARMAELLRRRIRDGGVQQRIDVVESDFRSAPLEPHGRMLFLGNPPYVRHHDIEAKWKQWYRDGMAARGIGASQLAGLHAHFMLRAVQLMRPGDTLCFVTAAEWLDNGYGSALRALFTTEGGAPLRSLWLAPADEPVFLDALVSAVVVEVECMARSVPVRLGLIRQRRFERVREIESLDSGSRWSALCQPGWLEAAQGIELGELFRITRGQVTGRNDVWVLPAESDVVANELTVPAVTRAREIINGGVLAADARSRACKVVNLPRDLASSAPNNAWRRCISSSWRSLARGVPIRATSRGIACGSHSICVSPRPLSSATWAADRRCFGRTRSA